MYKLFEITYNDGEWHSGSLPHFFYIATSEEELVANSERYRQYKERQMAQGGSVWINEITEVVGRHGFLSVFEFENLDKFDISISVMEKEIK